ncbi:MAG: FAD-binding protein [Lachnospiraceae bacterium]|nr:FAD-binding protein [Lachnospiraceae bacterium]
MKTISRRDFLKGTAAGAVGVAMAGILGGCSSAEAATTAAETAAATTGAAESTPAETMPETAMESSGAAPGGEGGGPGGPGGPGGSGAVETKEVLIDASDPFRVTGEDGKTVYYSMRRTWVGEPPVIDESEIVEEYSADVVIVGANYSGANCFRMASEKGLSCIVLDSQAEESFSSFGGQLGHFNSEWQEKVLGIAKDYFDPVDFIDSYQLQSAGRAQPDLIRQFAHRNGEIVDWITELYEDVTAITSNDTIDPNADYNYKKGYFMTYPACLNLGSGSFASSGEYCKATVQKGIASGTGSQAFYNMSAQVLIKDGETVCGVIAKNLTDDKYYRFLGKKGVVLATGDFSANSDMYRSLCTEVQECNPYSDLTGAGWDGYGHRMGIWAGAVMELGPRAAMGGATSALPMGFFGAAAGLWINKYGKRYCNEAFGVPFVAGCQSARQPMDSAIIQVWDEGHWREFAKNQALGHFNASDITETKMDEYAEKLKEIQAAGAEGVNGVFCADTLEELAVCLGFEGEYAANFVESVKTYDAYAAAGRDEDYAKPADMMFRISEGPFYAEKLTRNANIVLVTLAGLFVDGNQQCLNQDFEPIPGLYATGNASGGRFPLQYTAPMNGISIGFATVFGALLGEYLATKA